MTRTPSRVRIGSFELDLGSGELRSSASDGSPERIVLREQPFQVLRMLVEREGKILTRNEIKKALWPNDTIVDFDHSINVAIGVLRRALGDSAASPRYIETLARRGYRLLAPVEPLDSGPPADRVAFAPLTLRSGDLTGKKVCHYRVLEVLGGGGMGMVYKAEDLKLGRRAALKFLPEELASDPVALQRLQREAQTASALNHPNICTIYDIEEHGGQPFIAMELLEGETLQQRLASAPTRSIPFPVLIDIASQVCLGLAAAHGKDIVHRDIKPANIFLTEQGPVKLLDFGVAKLVAGEDIEASVSVDGGPPSANIQPNLTRAGVTVGTTGYMSPEQVRQEQLDGRSDLFSLGMVLYEMATGQRAFTGETAVAVQQAILATEPPAVDSLNPGIPASLASVIRKALEKDRSRRYQTAMAMVDDLDRVRREALHAGRGRVGRWITGAAAAVAVGLVAWFSTSRATGVALGANDTIVIAHLTNATSDRVFDEALYTALRIALEQTPYLNVLADNKVRETLSSVGVDSGARVTPEIALQVCQHTSSRIVVAPAIAEAGNRLRLQLEALDCQSKSSAGRFVSEAASRNDVVSALGTAALQLRKALGEPSSSIARFNAPLQEATSASPDALELLTIGYRRHLAGNSEAAIPYYQRAVQADPMLTLAHAALSTAYANGGENARAAAAGRIAFDQRNRLTMPGRFNVASTYHREVTGDWEQSCAVLSEWVQVFPHDVIARNNFSYCLSVLGQPDRALGEAREAARLLPAAYIYGTWIHRALLADRTDEAQAAMDDALRRGFDPIALCDFRVRIAFQRRDAGAMNDLWADPAAIATPQVLFGRALVESYHGRFRAAGESASAAAALAAKAGSVDDYLALNLALKRIDAGLGPEDPLTLGSNPTLRSRLLLAVAFARLGRLDDAEQIAGRLRQDYPSNTIVHKYGLPVIEAAMKLRSNDPAGAVAVLAPVGKFDLSESLSLPGLYPSYIRGLAFLEMGDGASAAGEFQRILAHPGAVGRDLIGALAVLQLARAHRVTRRDSAAAELYQAFLGLWQDADHDVPIYRDARTEYDALRTRHSANLNRE